MISRFEFHSHGITSDRLRLYYKDFCRIPVGIPPLPEQRQIAAILSTWDRAIELTAKLIAAKQQRKAVLMQTLLTGQVRLPGFAGEWQRMELGKFATRVGQQVQWKDGSVDLPCVELEHVEQRTGSLIGSTMLSKLTSLKNRFQKGQVLFGKLRPNLRKYLLAPFDGACSTEIWVLDAIHIHCVNPFLFYLVQGRDFRSASLTTSGSKMPRAEWSIVSETDFHLPPLDEQKAIAAVLNNADTELALHRRKLDALRRQKKGLMQQLLTGKVRVAVTESSAE